MIKNEESLRNEEETEFYTESPELQKLQRSSNASADLCTVVYLIVLPHLSREPMALHACRPGRCPLPELAAPLYPHTPQPPCNYRLLQSRILKKFLTQEFSVGQVSTTPENSVRFVVSYSKTGL